MFYKYISLCFFKTMCLYRDIAVNTPEVVTRRCSVKRGVLKGFTKFTGKYLCQGLFFNKVAGLKIDVGPKALDISHPRQTRTFSIVGFLIKSFIIQTCHKS